MEQYDVNYMKSMMHFNTSVLFSTHGNQCLDCQALLKLYHSVHSKGLITQDKHANCEHPDTADIL